MKTLNISHKVFSSCIYYVVQQYPIRATRTEFLQYKTAKQIQNKFCNTELIISDYSRPLEQYIQLPRRSSFRFDKL